MFGIGTGELILILIIATLVVGPERMVQLSRQMGEMIAKFRQQTDSVTQEFREAFDLETDELLGEGEEEATTEAAGAEAQGEAIEAALTDEGQPNAETAEVAADVVAEEEIVLTQAEELEVELASSLFDGEIEVVAAAEKATDIDKEESDEVEQVPDPSTDIEPTVVPLVQFVPEDVDVEPVLIEEPVLVASEQALDVEPTENEG